MYTIVHAIAGYLFLLLTVRVLVRRPGAQLTPFEFVIVFLIGGVIILATVGNDHSLTNCTCAIITVGLVHRLVALARVRIPRIGAWIDGVPMVILRDGEWQVEVMDGLRVDPDDVMAAAREKGFRSLAEIKYAVIERNGAISVIPHENL
ncbi:MAG: DUF421 domain-containing protein [Acidobacteriota bacterium]